MREIEKIKITCDRCGNKIEGAWDEYFANGRIEVNHSSQSFLHLMDRSNVIGWQKASQDFDKEFGKIPFYIRNESHAQKSIFKWDTMDDGPDLCRSCSEKLLTVIGNFFKGDKNANI